MVSQRAALYPWTLGVFLCGLAPWREAWGGAVLRGGLFKGQRHPLVSRRAHIGNREGKGRFIALRDREKIISTDSESSAREN